jgi:RNA polymerase sigma-70 factor, ECF subfamily
MEDLLDALRSRHAGAQRKARAWLFPRVLAVCQRLLSDKALAEQTAEDVWLDFLYGHVDAVRSAAAVEGYLKMMTVRRCRRTRDQQTRHTELDEQLLAPVGSEAETVAVLDHRRLTRRLDTCLGQLTPRTRQALSWRYHEELTQEDIGRRFGFTKQYAGRLLAQGLETLRRCLEATP